MRKMKAISIIVSIILISAVLFLCFMSRQAAISAIAGGLICLVASLYFFSKMSRYHGRWEAKRILVSFYQAQVIKALLIVTSFLCVFKFFGHDLLLVPFIVTFTVCYIFSSIIYGLFNQQGIATS